MEDLNQQINQILSDPQSMQQIQSMMNALGLNGAQNTAETAPPAPPPQAPSPAPRSPGLDPAALAGMLSSLGLGGGTQSQPAPAPDLGLSGALSGLTPQMLQTVTKIAPLLSQVNREDESTQLLRALRPLLGPARQKKLDEAIKILQMMRLLPLLKDSGLFSGLLSGLF